MVRSDEFFNLTIDLEGGFSEGPDDRGAATKYGITQAILNSFNYKHSLSMERVEIIRLEKAKDIYLEFFYLPVKSVINAEIHFNFVDVTYNSGHGRHLRMLSELGENFTILQIYEWRENYYKSLNELDNINGWLNRLDIIKKYFKQR